MWQNLTKIGNDDVCQSKNRFDKYGEKYTVLWCNVIPCRAKRKQQRKGIKNESTNKLDGLYRPKPF
eukprot:10815310-Ditylum_brightwellii.AAC.1